MGFFKDHCGEIIGTTLGGAIGILGVFIPKGISIPGKIAAYGTGMLLEKIGTDIFGARVIAAAPQLKQYYTPSACFSGLVVGLLMDNSKYSTTLGTVTLGAAIGDMVGFSLDHGLPATAGAASHQSLG